MRRFTLVGIVLPLVLLVGTAIPAFAVPLGVPFVVVEDFEDSDVTSDGSAEGFSAVAFPQGAGELFTDPQLGTVVDGSGDQSYELREILGNQAFLSEEALSDFDLRFDVKILSGAYGILFGATPGQDGYFLDSQHLTTIVGNAMGDPPIAVAPGPAAAPGDYTVRLRVVGDRIKVFRDGKLILSVTDSTFQGGTVGLVEVGGGTIQVDNIVLRRIPRAPAAGGTG